MVITKFVKSDSTVVECVGVVWLERESRGIVRDGMRIVMKFVISECTVEESFEVVRI
jgi:hypothetical protein